MSKQTLREDIRAFTDLVIADPKSAGEYEHDLIEVIKGYIEELIGEDNHHTDHSDKDEWYACVECMDNKGKDELRSQQRAKVEKDLS